MSEKRNRRDTGINRLTATSYAGMPISNVDMVTEEREACTCDRDTLADGMASPGCPVHAPHPDNDE